MRRRFNQSERRWLFFESEGVCQICGEALDMDWEADHIKPYSKGGETATRNGQAVCLSCNRKKGATMQYQIPAGLREPQRESIEMTREKIAQGASFQLNLLAPGTGKSLTAIATADYLFAKTQVERVIFVTIRTNLKSQLEDDYGMYRELYSGQQHHVRFVEDRSKTPLFDHGERGTIAAVTYDYVIRNIANLLKYYSDHTTAWILDEADRLGQATRYAVDGTAIDGLQASQAIERIYKSNPGFMLMTTGYPYRHDGKPLILCDKLGYYRAIEGEDEGIITLEPDVDCSLARSIKLRYLRPLTLVGRDGDFEEYDLIKDETTRDRISNRERRLADILKRPEVWQPLTQDAIEALVEARAKMGNVGLKALITAIDNSHAAHIYDHIVSDGRFMPVICTTQADPSDEAITAFRRNQAGDICITVQKASIGFDNKHVAVVGLLWNVRSEGANRQAIGRGMRWLGSLDDTQYCHVVYPEDKLMIEIMDSIGSDNEQGKAERIPAIEWPKESRGTTEDSGVPTQETVRIMMELRLDDEFSIRGTHVDGFVGGDDAEYCRVIAKRYGFGLHVAASFLQEVRRYAQGEQPTPQYRDEYDELEATYGASRQGLSDAIKERIKWHIDGLRPEDCPNIGIWRQAAYSVIKRTSGGNGIGDANTPMRLHKLYKRLRYDIEPSEIVSMYRFISRRRSA